MRSSYIAAVAAALLAPAFAAAQPAYVTPPATYTFGGCGDAFRGGLLPVVPNAVCVTGILEIGTIFNGPSFVERDAWYAFNTTVSSALPTKNGVELDPDDPRFSHYGTLPGQFATTFDEVGVGPFGPNGSLPADLARSIFFVYTPVPNPDPTGQTVSIQVALTFTATPEPATLALTLGGLAVLGAGAWRRRRA